MLVFEEWGEPECTEKKNLSEQSREPATNSSHIWHHAGIWTRATLGGGEFFSFRSTMTSGFLDIISLGSFGSSSCCYIYFDVLQCIFNGFNCGTLLQIQEKGNGIASYLLSELRQNCRALWLMTTKWARAAFRGIRTSGREDEQQWSVSMSANVPICILQSKI